MINLDFVFSYVIVILVPYWPSTVLNETSLTVNTIKSRTDEPWKRSQMNWYSDKQPMSAQPSSVIKAQSRMPGSLLRLQPLYDSIFVSSAHAHEARHSRQSAFRLEHVQSLIPRTNPIQLFTNSALVLLATN